LDTLIVFTYLLTYLLQNAVHVITQTMQTGTARPEYTATVGLLADGRNKCASEM